MGFTREMFRHNEVIYPVVEMTCPMCNKTFTPNKEQRRAMAVGKQNTCFCSVECYRKHCSTNRRGANNPHWKGGVVDISGYTAVTTNRYRAAGYINEHILVAEQQAGRKLLPNEVVHHINGDRKDNRAENLVIMTRSDHMRLHATERHNQRRNANGNTGHEGNTKKATS